MAKHHVDPHLDKQSQTIAPAMINMQVYHFAFLPPRFGHVFSFIKCLMFKLA